MLGTSDTWLMSHSSSCQSSQSLIWFIPDSSVQTTYLAGHTSSSVTPLYIILVIRDKTRRRFSVKSDIVPMANSQELLLREMGLFIVQCPFTPLKAIFLLFSCLMNNYKSIRQQAFAFTMYSSGIIVSICLHHSCNTIHTRKQSYAIEL